MELDEDEGITRKFDDDWIKNLVFIADDLLDKSNNRIRLLRKLRKSLMVYRLIANFYIN